MTFKCSTCFKEFSTKQWLKYHLNKKSPCVKAILCEYCNKIFDHSKSLARHVIICPKNPEGVTKSYQCPKCQNGFTRKEHMLCHMRKSCEQYKGELPATILKDANSVKFQTKIHIDNSFNNVDNSVTNNDNSVNMSVMNITTNGNEYLGHITDEFMQGLLEMGPVQGCVRYITEVFFNEKIWENHKFLVSNINSRKGGVELSHELETLIRTITKELIKSYVDTALGHMCCYYASRSISGVMSDNEREFYEHVMRIFFEREPIFRQDHRRLIEYVTLTAYNNKAIPLETFNALMLKL